MGGPERKRRRTITSQRPRACSSCAFPVPPSLLFRLPCRDQNENGGERSDVEAEHPSTDREQQLIDTASSVHPTGRPGRTTEQIRGRGGGRLRQATPLPKNIEWIPLRALRVAQRGTRLLPKQLRVIRITRIVGGGPSTVDPSSHPRPGPGPIPCSLCPSPRPFLFPQQSWASPFRKDPS